MATTADYLNKLIEQKNALADNLTEKGVTATHDETLETLIPKVLDISGGSGEQLGIYPIDTNGVPTGDVIVPNGVTTIINSNALFNGNKTITSVSLPSSVTTVSSSGFSNCTVLAKIAIHTNGNILLNSYAFNGCASFEGFEFSNDSTSISLARNSNYVFTGCKLGNNSAENILKRITSDLGNYAFSQCNGLTELTLDKLGNHMFYSCSNIAKLIIQDGVTNMPEGAFRSCTSLKYIKIPSSIVSCTSSSLTASITNAVYFLQNDKNIESIELGSDWNMSINLSISDKLTHDSILQIVNGLKDLSNDDPKTLTLGETNLAKLTDEEKAIATNKNWTLA